MGLPALRCLGVLDLLFPKRCVICRNLGEQLCDTCLAGLHRIPLPLCERCGAPTGWPVRRCGECAGRRLAFASARSAIVYDDAARALVRSWKERGLRELASVAAELVARAVAVPEAVALCPVPPDPDRALTRGEHPATALARELGRRWRLPVVAPIARTAPRPRQAGLARADRRGNVRGTFRATAEAPARVCLVDDVYTTGETVNAAASALRKAGARRVHVVSLAKGRCGRFRARSARAEKGEARCSSR